MHLGTTKKERLIMSNSTNSTFRFAKSSAKKLMATTAMTAAGLLMFSGAAKAADDFSDHTYAGGSVGSSLTVTVDIPNSTTNIDAVGSVVKARGDGDLKANWIANINQDSSSAKYVLFDTEADPTYIRGQLNANGQVFIFDKDGVIFGADSIVNVGGILASSGDLISDVSQLENNHIIINSVDTDGAVRTGGTINVMTPENGGFAAFVAPTVSNSGIINARMGNVVMAAGETVTLDLYGDGLVEVAVDGKLADGLIENQGAINAQGGVVQISAAIAKDAIENVINMEGVVDVSSVSQKGGKIILSGGDKGVVKVSGIANASGATGGGEIDVTGQDIEVSKDAIVLADANNEGNGGNVKFYANRNAVYRGSVYARGGATSGNGGFVELSAANEVGYDGSVNTSAVNGEAGSFLLDPLFAVIHSGSIHTPLGFDYILSAEALANDIHRNGSVTVQADEFIDVGTDLDLTIPLVGTIGNGDIDMSAYDYDVLNTHGTWMWWLWTTDNYSGTTAGDLTLDTQTVNFNKNLTLGTGNLNILADTVNLDGTLSDINGLLDQGDITSTASVVNVLSAAALIQQGIYVADDGATVNVEADTYNESVTVAKSVTLNGANAGVAGTGARGAESKIDPSSPGFHVTADNVVIDGFEIATGTPGVHVDNANNVTIKNNWIHDQNDTGSFGDDGIRADNSQNLTITRNLIEDISDEGIYTEGNVDGLNITQNTIRDIGNGIGNPQPQGIQLNNASGIVNISENFLDGVSESALWVSGNADVTFFNNSVTNFGEFAVENLGSTIVDASGNYWGTDVEADVATAMSGDVDFSPFLMLSTDRSAATGFQGDFSKLFVTALGEQTQTGGRINEAVDLLQNGGLTNGNREIHVGAGTFNESVIVDKAVTLLGANAGIDGFFTVRNPESIVTGGSPAFTVTADNVTIDGFTMDGPTLTYGVKLNDVKGIEVVNNIIKGSSVAGIGGVVDHDDAVQVDLLVEGNKIDDSNTGDGINISGDGAGAPANTGSLVGSRIDITNNLIGTDGSDLGGSNNGVGGSAIVFSKIGDPTGAADAHYGYNVVTDTEINITSNFIRGAVDGIRFDGDVDEANIDISGNSNLDGVVGTGVKVVGDLTNSDVAINSNGTVSGTVGGIAFDGSVDASEVEIDDNTTIFSALADAIRFNGITGGSVVDITENNAITAGGNGINFSSPGSASIDGGSVVTVAKNTINATFDGIYVDDDITGAGTRLNIGANTITADRDGIDVDHIGNDAYVNIGGSIAHDSGTVSTNKGNIIVAGGNGIEADAGVDALMFIQGNRISAGQDGVNIRDDDSGHTTGVDGGEVRISNNDIGSVGSDTIGDDGIQFQDSITGATVVIQGNNIGRSGAKVGNDGIEFDSITDGSYVGIYNNPNNYASDNGIQVNGVIDGGAHFEVSGNNHGIHANNHGVYFNDNITDADIDIHGNIISANENNNGLGDGIRFDGDIYTATVNIGDGNGGSLGSSPSNFIRGVDGIHFAGELNSGTQLVIDGNRIGYGKTGGGSVYTDAVNDDGIQFDQDIQGGADVKITDNWINSDDDGINFGDDIQDNARVLIGGSSDGNTIFAGNEGIQIEGDVKDHSLLEISHNNIEAGDNGIQFNGNTSNHLHNGNPEEILIAYNSIEADTNGILFEGEASNELHDIVIRNNTKIHGHDGDGIRHEGGIDDAELTIKDNDNIFGDIDGIHIEGAFRNDAKILIDNNTDIDSENGDGIEVTQSGSAGGVDLDITSNHVHYTGDNGIEVDNVDNADISNNRIHDTGNDGINVEGGYDVAIYQNDIEDTDGNGIYVEDSNEAYVSWNIIKDAEENGIYINSSDNVDVFGNEIDNVDEHGIKVNPSDFVNIAYNRIHDAGWDGINVQGGRYADIYENHVHRVGDDGIDVDGNYKADVNDNTVKNTGLAWWSDDGNGIEVSNSFDADIRDNYIERAGDDGIEVDDSAYAGIRGNEVHDSGDDGIDVDDSRYVDINNNHIHGARENGIKVTDSFDADVIGNRIHYVGDDGIYASNVFGADIRGNDIHHADRDGIDVEDSNFVDVNFNTVDRVGGNGIEIQNSDNADIIGNRVSRARENGIYVNPSDNVNIGFNIVGLSGQNGIDVNGGHNINIFRNLVGFNGRDGINVDGSRHVDIMNNISFANRGDGIDVNANHNSYHYTPNEINITGNTTNRNGDNGIEVSGDRNVNGIELLVDGNTTSENGDNGIEIIAEAGYFGPSAKVALVSLVPSEFNSVISNNIVENNTNNGLYVAGGGHDNVEVSGNTFTENDIGALFESGTIDLTGDGNLFDGGRIGMRFAPAIIGYDFPTLPTLSFAPLVVSGDPIFADMSLVGNTIGSQTFDGQDFYVELDNGAFFAPGTPTLLDATDSTFVTGTGLGTIGPQLFYTAEQIAFLESKFTHFNDNLSTGLFFFPQLADIDQEDIFQFFSANPGALGGLNVTLRGLPNIPGGPGTVGASSGFSAASLNDITPAAGGDGGLTPEELNALETAAGGEEGSSATCWGDALNSAGAGGSVNFSYGDGAEGLLNSEASCGS